MLRLSFFSRGDGQCYAWIEADGEKIRTMSQPGEEEGMAHTLAMRHRGESAEDFLRRLAQRHFRFDSVLEDTENPRSPRAPTPAPTGRFVMENPEGDAP